MPSYANKYLDGDGLSHLWAKIKLLVQNTYSPSSATPLMDGVASVGSSTDFARGDHVHPSDTTKLNVADGLVDVSFNTTNGFREYKNGVWSTVVTVANLKSALGVVDTDMTGATASSAGTHGLVPAPAAGEQGLFLRGDGDWALPPQTTDTTYTLSGALSSHKFTNTLTPSSGTATTSELTLAAGTRITLTDDTANNKITIATTAEVNQNAFSNVAVSGQTTVAADSKTDTLNLANGNNISITTNATSDTVTIGVTGIANGAEVNQNAFSNVAVSGQTTVAAESKTDTLNLAEGANVTITTNASTDTVTIAATDTTYSDVVAGGSSGLMTGADKTKLDGIEAGAEVNRTYTVVTGKPTANASPGFGGTVTISQISQDATGQISATDRTITFPSERTYTSFNGKPTANQTPAFGSTFTISQIAQSTTGQVSGTDRTVKIPDTLASGSGPGLMSSSDYNKLAAFSQASDYALKTDISGVYKYKGSVANEAALPASGQTTGDVYNIEADSTYGPAGTNVAWDGTAWDALGGLFSIDTLTNAEIDAICV